MHVRLHLEHNEIKKNLTFKVLSDMNITIYVCLNACLFLYNIKKTTVKYQFHVTRNS
jgi:hypothetical protein